ncbi:hypothetical protein FE275_21100 [Pseudomonas koreensis]|uniref:Uncharacterized protein n=1 Tax=Pseudomonas jessenii TaxID=77298 RepID=A0A5C4KUF0_PSEJE|nr:hypothetical protein FE275_21100 [Pseudomonas koreensis]TNB93725.1 hypothetical protein FHG55_18570 [Pseudomonas jessenii]
MPFRSHCRPCGSGLARECGVSDTWMSTDTTLSRASPLPQWISGVYPASTQTARQFRSSRC